MFENKIILKDVKITVVLEKLQQFVTKQEMPLHKHNVGKEQRFRDSKFRFR